MTEKDENTRERSAAIAAEVTPEVRAAVEEIARQEERSISFMTWKLLMESPRVKAKVKELQRA